MIKYIADERNEYYMGDLIEDYYTSHKVSKLTWNNKNDFLACIFVYKMCICVLSWNSLCCNVYMLYYHEVLFYVCYGICCKEFITYCNYKAILQVRFMCFSSPWKYWFQVCGLEYMFVLKKNSWLFKNSFVDVQGSKKYFSVIGAWYAMQENFLLVACVVVWPPYMVVLWLGTMDHTKVSHGCLMTKTPWATNHGSNPWLENHPNYRWWLAAQESTATPLGNAWSSRFPCDGWRLPHDSKARVFKTLTPTSNPNPKFVLSIKMFLIVPKFIKVDNILDGIGSNYHQALDNTNSNLIGIWSSNVIRIPNCLSFPSLRELWCR